MSRPEKGAGRVALLLTVAWVFSGTPAVGSLPLGRPAWPRSVAPTVADDTTQVNATSCSPVWSTADGQNVGTAAIFYGISVSTRGDAWAVAYSEESHTEKTLIEHWDGRAWVIVPSPNQGNGDNILYGVDAISANDVWAVGFYEGSDDRKQTLIEHWDGTAWVIVSSPNVGSEGNVLRGVSASSATDVWAVGWSGDDGDDQTLIEHWDGLAWSIVASGNIGPSGNFLYGVSVTSRRDGWAAGYAFDPTTEALVSVIEHWDGSAWSIVSTPNPSTEQNTLFAVSAVSPSTAWAVGWFVDAVGLQRPLTLRWNGSVWSVDPTPPGMETLEGDLFGLGAVSAGDAWATGWDFTGGQTRILIEHWDGAVWSLIPSPPIFEEGFLYGAAADSRGHVWAAGIKQGNGAQTLSGRLCEVRVLDSGFVSGTASGAQGGAVAWNVDSGDASAHSVADGSGMGLFDSGLRPPGDSYTFAFDWAGTYPVRDAATGSTMNVQVPALAEPPSGNPSTEFTVTWASGAAPPGYVFDVQIERPGSTHYVVWKSNQTDTSATFVADAGTGTYRFRSRLKLTTGPKSGWSPAAAITVV